LPSFAPSNDENPQLDASENGANISSGILNNQLIGSPSDNKDVQLVGTTSSQVQPSADPSSGDNPKLEEAPARAKLDQLTEIAREIVVLVQDEPPTDGDRQEEKGLINFLARQIMCMLSTPF
jgi:hypothetical protein